MILENLRIAFLALWANKLRSALTTLGIIIGIAAVIMLIAMGQGVKKEITKEIESIGTNVLIVLPGKVPVGENKGSLGQIGGLAGVPSLTNADKKALSNISGIDKIAGVSLITSQISYKDKKIYPLTMGVDPDIAFTSLYEIRSGRMFNIDEVEKKERLVVVGTSVAKELEEGEIVGKKIIINGLEFEVVGTIKTAAQAQLSVDTNELALIPITIAQDLGKTDRINRLLIQVKGREDVDKVAKQVKEILLKRHNNVEDFSVLTQEELLGTVSTILSLLTSLLAGIAAISLLVGGIGIMNIMLVSVTERTREIGIRKAVGATRFNILSQFLTEAVVLSLVGGGLGIAVASLGTFLIAKIASVPTLISLDSVILAVGVSIAVGLFFGIAPAIRAALKDPIEALRYE